MHNPVVFLPGMMCDLRLFAWQLLEFGRDRAVTVAPITMGERIEEIASNILDRVPPKFALAGVSMGGIVAMEMLRRAPDRITRIALISTNSLAETPQSAAEYEPSIIKLRSGQLEEAVKALMPAEHIAAGAGRAAVLAELNEMAKDLGPEGIIKQLRALQRRRDYQSVLRKCKVPALVMCGDQDGLTPVKRHRLMAELIPYAELKVIEGAGHLPTLEQASKTNEALHGWLKQPFVLQAGAKV
ncbi:MULTISPECIES: alpha/beta fold hydrolase [unclassified Roseovarius]|uniref:alpha/beta fold hydrolase n=1 Tax=unclassified Roseovarius TaxID=2614913 RepID=UPI00273DAFF9|nr:MULTISPECIES: alpha/beta hydrolase [unclassified Roseovarius]